MKNIIILVIVLSITGCRYKEGPLISFRKVETRLAGHWKIVSLTSDGVDSLQYYKDSCGSNVAIWIPHGESRYNIYFIGGRKEFQGSFYFKENAKIMSVHFLDELPFKIIGPFQNIRSDWEIRRLSNINLKIKTNVNNKEYVIAFKKY